MNTHNTSFRFVNNSGINIDMFMPHFEAAYDGDVLHEDIADFFEIEILRGYNADGTDRMIIDSIGKAAPRFFMA